MLELTSPIVRARLPRLVRHLPATLGIVALLAAPMLAVGLDQPFLIRVLTRVLVFSVAAVSLNVLMGFSGLISVMHAGLLGIGAYTVAILAMHAGTPVPFLPGVALPGTSNLLVSIPLAMMASAITAGLLGAVALRTRGAYFIMITLAFNQMIYYFFVSLDSYGGDEGLQITSPLQLGSLSLSDRSSVYYLCLFALICVLFCTARLVHSRFGTVLRAAMGNERRVASVGIAPTRYQWTAFVIAGAVAGLSGALLAVSQEFVSPADMSWLRSGELIVMVVLGGMSVVWGPAVGVLLYVLAETALSGLSTHWQLPFGILIILMVMLLRNGVAGAMVMSRTGQEKEHHHV